MPRSKRSLGLYRRGRIWWCAPYINGERLAARSLKTKSKSEAEKYAECIIAANVDKPREIIRNEKTMTISHLADDLILHKQQVAESTLNTYSFQWKEIEKQFGSDMLISEMTVAKANAFHEHLKHRGLSQDYRHDILGFLKNMYLHAERRGFLMTSPLRYLNLPAKKKVVIKYFSDEQVQKLLDHLCTKYGKYDMNYGAVIISLNTGMRKGECLELRFDWINWEKREIIIPADVTKSNKLRVVPIGDELLSYLTELYNRAVQKDGYALSSDGGATPYKNVKRAYRSALHAIGCDDYDFHTCRHTFATHYLVKNPGNLFDLMAICGWEDVETAKKYIHVTDDYRRELQRRVSGLYTTDKKLA